MVLSDRTIRRLLDEGRIEIDPYDPSLLQPSSVDVRVDRFFRVFHNARYPYIDVKEPQEELTELVEIDEERPFILHPGEFVLASTLERIRLPDDLVARLEGKSSLGRLGLLIHSTAGFIDPGWDGHVTLELSNVANLPITIYHAMKIGQLSFVQLTEPAETPVRRRQARLQVPGPARPDTEPLLRELPRARPVKVLVTGATGFVGPAVANAIVDAGHEVRVLERKSGSWRKAGIRCQQAVQGDMTDSDSLRRAAADQEVVVHLVAIRQGSREQFQRIMVDGTRSLLQAAEDAGVKRFVLMSALGTSEETKDLVPYYGAKWQQELDVKGSGLDHVIFRPSFIFGRDGGILPTFVKLAKLAPVTGIVGSGKQRIQPIWVDDAGASFAAAVDKPEAAGQTFELGGPDTVDWDELWQQIRGALGIRRRPTMHLPTGLMKIPAAVTERLPGNIPLTRDLLTMLEAGDNVVSNDLAVRTFGIPLVPLNEQIRRVVA